MNLNVTTNSISCDKDEVASNYDRNNRYIDGYINALIHLRIFQTNADMISQQSVT